MYSTSRIHKLFYTIGAVLIIALLGFGLWMTSELVLAYREIRKVHVFPTKVESTGWSNSSNSLIQDLAPEAHFGSFNSQNAAFVLLEGVEAEEEVLPFEAEATTTPSTATSTDPFVSEEEVATSTEEVLNESEGTKIIEVLEEDESATSTEEVVEEVDEVGEVEEVSTSTEEAVFDEISTEEESEIEVVEEETGTTTLEVSLLEQVINLALSNMRAQAQALFRSVVKTAFATTTGATTSESVPAETQDEEVTDEVEEIEESVEVEDEMTATSTETIATSTEEVVTEVATSTLESDTGTSTEEVATTTEELTEEEVEESDDTEAPVITIMGNNPAFVEVGSQYSDLGVVVSDNKSVNIGHTIFVDGVETDLVSLDTSTSSLFTITYEAEDLTGNKTIATRLVAVGEVSEESLVVPEIETVLAAIEEDGALEEVASCTVLGKDCYVLEFSGFGVGGDITSRILEGVELNLSFANATPEGAAIDDKLLVRYYHNGGWRHAGEIFLNKELSNGSNGGYFTNTLSDVTNWSDLEDIRVVVEYDRASEESDAQLYLDGIWIDTLYRETAENVISGEQLDEESGFGENVLFELRNGGSRTNTLELPDGSLISFGFTDDLEDTLMMRVDRAIYGVSTSASSSDAVVEKLYLSITNTGREEEQFNIFGAFPNASSSISTLSQFLRNVPETEEEQLFEDVTFLCESGWTQASSSERYVCEASGQQEMCSWLSESGENCLVSDVPVGFEETIVYESTWVERSVEPFVGEVEDALGSEGFAKGYSINTQTAELLTVLPDQTVYFEIEFDAESGSAGQFALYAVSDDLFGDIDSRLLERESVLVQKREEEKLAEIAEELDLTEQVSEKVDFDGDELPSFRFRFKTPRTFFERIRDSFLGRDTRFSVESARLRHAGGSVERVPVEIEYADNGEWTLHLSKRPRAFRPGRYSIELMLKEGEEVYTDTVDFYWGVLAINTNKSVYEEGETAQMYLAVLSDTGDTVCGAPLLLEITNPEGEVTAVPVENGEGCGPNNVTTLPDYTAEYPVEGVGQYGITLTRLNEEGEGAHIITDGFEVHEYVPLVVERSGPTRIYPPADYFMDITVTAKEGFTGTITEIMPEGFTVESSSVGGTLARVGGNLELSWDVDLEAGETAVYSYEFDAPDVSPYLYVLGPAVLSEGDEIEFEEVRTWKIASDAVSIAAGVAWISATTTTNGTDLNESSAYALEWTNSSEFDDTYYSHSTSTNPTQLTVDIDGDYLIAITVPMERTDSNNSRTRIEAEIRVNGTKQSVGVARSSYIRNNGSHTESSDNFHVLLEDLSAGDYIEVYLSGAGNLTVDSGDDVIITGQASLYAEYISGAETIFTATATTTAGGTNFSPTSASEIVWFSSTVDTGYTHSNSSSPQDITLDEAGDYMVFINIPLESSTARSNVLATVRLGGVIVAGGEFKQGYIRNSENDNVSSIHWSGVIRSTTTNQTVNIDVIEEANTPATVTVGSEVGTIYIQKLPSTDVYFGRATDLTSGTNWNPGTQAQIEWETDEIIDTSVYTHSTTTNPHQITIDQDGDYLLVYNDSLNGGSARSNPRITVEVNSTARDGAQTKSHYQRADDNNNEASGSLVFLMRDLETNDVITVSTQQEGNGGTVNDDQDAILLLWRKAQQSPFTQNVYRWYVNEDAQTPTDAWPSGATDLTEDEAITAGISVLNGDELRIRMSLQSDSTVTAGADSFKLQYAPGVTCSPALSWVDVGTTTSSEIWRSVDNASVSAGSTLSSTTLSVTDVAQTYEEDNPSAVTPNGMTTGQDGEWDWVIENNSATEGTDYCFRMVGSSGEVLGDYVEYPQLVTNSIPETPTASAPFANEKTASTSPHFEFTTTDANTEDIHYAIEIDDDINFLSIDLSRNSQDHFGEFENIDNPPDKSPFTSGQTVRFTPSSALTNGTTYWWRVRARDPNGTNEWSSYSAVRSFTVDTSLTASAWFQTTEEQFDTDTLDVTDATTGDDVEIVGVAATGTITGTTVDFDDGLFGNAWGEISWNDTETNGTINYQLEYFTSTSSWNLIPDVDLPGNSSGFGTSPVQITTLDTTTYNQIRLVGNLVRGSGTPVLHDWTIAWALAVNQPTVSQPFSYEKVGTTTPTFQFITDDPQGDDLVYEISISTSTAFDNSTTTRNSTDHTGFTNTASSTDTSPFTENETIQFQLQIGDALTDGETYWWRVRARDPSGGDAFSLWSTPRSFTVDTTVAFSTWFQTTTEQFEGGTFTRTEAASDNVTVSADTGKVAIYREAGATDTITTSNFDHEWDSTVRQDDIYNLNGTTNIELDAGRYAVFYGSRFDSTSGSNRSEIQTHFNLDGTDLPIGWSQGYIRRTGGADETFTSGGGIIEVDADGDVLLLRSFRTDANSAGVQREPGASSIQFVRLEDSWNYLRLSKTGTQNGPTSASFVDVTYDRQDEVDTDAFSHATGSSQITLKNAGHYLVFANTYGALPTGVNDRTEIIQKLTLNGGDVPGSFTTVYVRGNQSSENAQEGAVSTGMIIETTTSNEVLNVEVARGDGTTSWTINNDEAASYVDRTAITIVELPDADFIRLSDDSVANIMPAALTEFPWNTQDEIDTASFTHSTTTNNSQITVDVDDDYLFFSTQYADGVSVARAVYNQGWSLNSGALLGYGQTGNYNRNSGANDFGNWSGNIFENLTNGDYISTEVIELGTSGTAGSDDNGLQGVRIGSLVEADTRPITFDSPSILFSDGLGPKWEMASTSDTTPVGTDILYQVLYRNASGTMELIPDGDLPGNSVGTTSATIDLGSLSILTYDEIALRANFTCDAGTCPTLHDWTVAWSEGITISGTAQEYDESTNVTSGTVAVAVNGTIQSGKTGSIVAGAWSITNVTIFANDIATIFIDGAANANEAVAITKYDGADDITGMQLFERHVTLGSDDFPTLTNTDLSQYDVDQDEDVFHDVDGANDLEACAVSGCEDVELYIKSGTIYQPDSGNSGDIETHDVEINGTLDLDGNTMRVSGSWENNATSSADTSTIIFTQTSGTETIDSSAAIVGSFYNVTLGESFGSATWNLSSDIDIDGATSIDFGTLGQNGANDINLAGNFTVSSGGLFSKGTGTTTFDGTGSNTWTDNTTPKQDMGTVVIDGTTKTVVLGSATEATDFTIGADDTFDVSASDHAFTVGGDWTNNNTFTPRSGTVTFSSTTLASVITPGSSAFNSVTFDGTGASATWSFTGDVDVNDNLTITAGSVTLPNGTTTVGGSFSSSDTFLHNNGVVLFDGSGSETITPGASSFFDLDFNGTGSWAFVGTHATSSNDTTIEQGSVTLPSNALVIGGSFLNTGGAFVHNNAALQFTSSASESVTLGGSNAYDLTFTGTGDWTMTDTSATALNTVTISSGTTTLPSTTFAVGGSWDSTGGEFAHNSGTVLFNSGDSGETVNPGASSFSTLTFDSTTGGWTITGSATSTGNTNLTNASDFTLTSGESLEVGGTFTNSVAGASTTWAGSTLYLNSATAYTVNTKTGLNEDYENLLVGANTDIEMWNSAATTTSVDSTGSLYSQDHDSADGDLYIWGEYITTDNEHWSYETDFDGVDISGSPRQANVYFNSGSSIDFSSATLAMLGTTTASTTVQNQGSGSFTFDVTGGTLNASYYQIRNTDSAGMSILGTTTVTSLDDGDFELSVVSGGTMITLASTTIDQNTALEIQRVRFATSSGVTGGNNVTLGDASASYWWFRNHYGNFDGEANDSDPSGDPGNIRWDDSGFTITVSGVVYSNHGTSTLGAPTCNGSTPVVTVVVDGGSSFTGSCDSGTGAYSIPGVTFVGDAVLTTYLDTNGGARAVTVTRTPITDITDMDLYQNSLIVRHEGADALSIAELAEFDSTDDTDVFFAASTSTTDTLTTEPDTELFVWAGDTFEPGGNVTLDSGGSGDARDGSLYIDSMGTFRALGTESHIIGGRFFASTSATFTPANSTTTFAATTTGKSIFTASSTTFYNMVFNGSGGEWIFTNPAGVATTTIQNTFTLTTGTVSGTGDMVIQGGDLTGGGTFAMSDGEVQYNGPGDFGNANGWQFNDLVFGDGSSIATSTKTGSATTTILGILTVDTNHVLEAGSSGWDLAGGGTPFVINGTFDVQTAPFTYSATTTTTVADATYQRLMLTPSGVGSPVFTLQGGTFSIVDLIIGGGVNPVEVNANTNDPSITVTNDVFIQANATSTASNVGAFNVGGSWSNTGVFTSSGGTILFNSADTGETIDAGSSSFGSITFDSTTGGWTISASATSTGAVTLTNASDFTLTSGESLEVGGTFTNSIGGASTTWAGSTLYLNSGTSFDANTKTDTTDQYEILSIGANTHVRMWNSAATTTSATTTGSLYSQDHDNTNGDLYIWGAYERNGGSDYWSYETDFDGVDISGSPRQANVYIATSSSVTLTAGILDILGTTTASTTVQNQGVGRYNVEIAGGSLNANFYQFRNLNTTGVNISGSPTITSLDDGDFELDVPNDGTMIRVAGTAITANPVKVLRRIQFATSTGVATGSNVTAVGSTVSSWKFSNHYGNRDGEAFDSDPDGDPGYVVWDDSAANITISGNVYADEGSTVSAQCDDSTQVVRLRVEGAGSFTSSCSSATGAYSISSIGFNPGDRLIVYLDHGGTATSAANVSVDPITNISDMHLYESRVIVRHEDTTALTIEDMATYDSGTDTDVPFDAVDAATDTLTLDTGVKLLVWNNKTFNPVGLMTLSSLGTSESHDGTIEVLSGGALTLPDGTHSLGGSFILDSTATLSTSGGSTLAFTGTTTGKVLTLQGDALDYITFSGGGTGAWSFTDATVEAKGIDVAAGTLTLASGTTTVEGSFTNTSGTFAHNNGTLLLTGTSTNESIDAGGSDFYNLYVENQGSGTYQFVDSPGYATTSHNFIVATGTVALPSNTLAVGGSFDVVDTFTPGTTVRLFSTGAGEIVRASGSSFYELVMDGVGGEWTFQDSNLTVDNNFTITNGSSTLPSGTFTVNGSFTNSDTFNHATGTVLMSATSTGNTLTAGGNDFFNLSFNSTSGGWTITDSATTTNDFDLANALSFTLTSGESLEVGGTFTNSEGGANTDWDGSTLFLNSGTPYAVNSSGVATERYETLLIGTTTQVSMWNSSATTTTVDPVGYLYSQDHAGVDGDLYIYGSYSRSTGNDYWSYATDFNGTSLGGSSRKVDVFIASSSSVTLTGGTLSIIGATNASTTIQNQGTGRYSLNIEGGTINANYYEMRNLDETGLNITGSPTVTSLSLGDFEMDVPAGGSMITVDATAIDANASLAVTQVRFATSSGVSSGFNVTRTGSPTGSWNFSGHYGNYDGEDFDSDGGDSCGQIRWSDSACLFVSQEHFRWRNDDGGAGVPDDEWYSALWGQRKKVAITNPNATAYTNLPVRIVVQYDSDMQSDFDDLRFTDSSGTTTISHWIEEVNASASSTVWVNVPSIATSSSAEIFMYYGNGSVSDGSSGTTTFTFFDNFEDDDITDYSGDTSLFDTDTTFANNGTYGLDAGSNFDQQTTSGIYRTGSLVAQGQTLRFYQYVDSTTEDEPCTLFAVQGSGQNYAVCLDQYTDDQLSIAEDVTSNDGSGTILASTSVTWSTGWYEVEIDWLTDDSITATVYDASGSEFASTTVTDSTYTSGGVGFSYWFQSGGWDFYSSRQYTASDPTYIFGAEQVDSGATWKAAEDTALTGQSIDENVRLRFSIQNTGTEIFGQEFRLQIAEKGVALSCAAVPQVNFNDVPASIGSCGSSPACMSTTTNFVDGDSAADLLSYPASLGFTEGGMVEEPSNETASSSVSANFATEVEYNLQFSSNATANSYCLRATNGGIALDNYDSIAEVEILHIPSISNFTLNSNQDITLTEGATTTITASSTVTDLNGYTDLAFGTSTMYRSGVGPSCAEDINNCYYTASTSCSFSDCSGNSCTMTCTADFEYVADPTDTGSPFVLENWLSDFLIVDQGGSRSTSTSPGVELLTLFGISIDVSSVDFGSLAVGADTGTINATTSIINTGNANIDIDISGTDLSDGGASTIGVGEQKYATSTFAYGSCTICQFLTGSATNVEVDLPKPTSTSTQVSDDLYWGISVPGGTAATLHTGTNTFIAVSE